MILIVEHTLRFLLGSICCDSYWGAYPVNFIREHMLRFLLGSIHCDSY